MPVGNNLLSLPDIPCLISMVRCGRDTHRISAARRDRLSDLLRMSLRASSSTFVLTLSRFRKIVDAQRQKIGAHKVSLGGTA
jgi:hypothetical protein